MTNTTTTTIIDLVHIYEYCDDIETHIDMLIDEADMLPDCDHRIDIETRIEYLEYRRSEGDRWVDNDTSASPTAWKTLETYTDAEALIAYQAWTE